MYEHQVQQQGAKRHGCMEFRESNHQQQKADPLKSMTLCACYAPSSNLDLLKLV